jgi:hypothetical protein
LLGAGTPSSAARERKTPLTRMARERNVLIQSM